MRHGESYGNISGRMISTTDSELTQRGRQQAEQVRRFIGIDFDVVFSSPLLRAKQTAEIVAQNSKIIIAGELIEMHIGILEGLTWDEISRDYPHINTGGMLSALAIPNGESFDDVELRCKSFVQNNLSGIAADANVLIVTHGITKRVMINHLLKRARGHVDHLDWCDNTSYSIIEYSDHAVQLLHLNERQHLVDNGLCAPSFDEWHRVSDNDYIRLGE